MNISHPAIKIDNGSKAWYAGKQRIQILQKINLSVNTNESLAVMGPSGAGKSTLLHILGFLTPLDEGAIWFNGQQITDRSQWWSRSLRQNIGFIFQDAKLIPELSVLENVCLPLAHRGVWPARQKKLARAEIAKVGLEDRAHHRPNQLSGGELMRVAIARAVVQKPKILLADEPTGNLDSRTGTRIVELLVEMVTSECALVFVTHNESLTTYADRIVYMKDGQLEFKEQNR